MNDNIRELLEIELEMVNDEIFHLREKINSLQWKMQALQNMISELEPADDYNGE